MNEVNNSNSNEALELSENVSPIDELVKETVLTSKEEERLVSKSIQPTPSIPTISSTYEIQMPLIPAVPIPPIQIPLIPSVSIPPIQIPLIPSAPMPPVQITSIPSAPMPPVQITSIPSAPMPPVKISSIPSAPMPSLPLKRDTTKDHALGTHIMDLNCGICTSNPKTIPSYDYVSRNAFTPYSSKKLYCYISIDRQTYF